MQETPRGTAEPASRWPRRLALSALAAAIPLVFFGGTVTTLHAGLAIDGWLVLDPGRGDYFLWLYPIDRWFSAIGPFVEHSHRLLGSLVGLLAIAAVVATFATDRRRLPRGLSVLALLAVVAQGVVGGLRVLEQSEDLAFLHGAIAQGVFALLGASYLAALPRVPREPRAAWYRLAWTSAISVYLQIVAGAWLRHGGGVPALAVHGVVAVFVAIVLLVLAKGLRGEAGSPVLRRWILGLLSAQLALGVAAFAVVWLRPSEGPGAVPALGTSVFPTLHVLVGGALLLACVACVFDARARTLRTRRSARGRAPEAPYLARLPEASHLARLPEASHLARLPEVSHLARLPEVSHLARLKGAR